MSGTVVRGTVDATDGTACAGLASVADTTKTLTAADKRTMVVTGSAAMYVINLGDARTYPLYSDFHIYNASSEFVGVQTTDLSTFHRVPPRARLDLIVTDISTASGVWSSCVHDPAVGNPAFGLSKFNDFVGGSAFTHGDFNFTLGYGGAGALCYTMSSENIVGPGRQGSIACYTGTTATGYALAHLNTNLEKTGGCCRAFECSVDCFVASAVGEEYIARCGQGDNITGGAHTESPGYFLYDHLTAGIVNWQIRTCKTSGGAAATQVDTGVPITFDNNTGVLWQKLRGELNSAYTRFDAWINDILVSPAGGLGNLPLAATAGYGVKHLNFGITKTAGLTPRDFAVEYARLQSYPTTPR